MKLDEFFETLAVIVVILILVVVASLAVGTVECPKCGSHNVVPVCKTVLWQCWDCGHIFTLFDVKN